MDIFENEEVKFRQSKAEVKCVMAGGLRGHDLVNEVLHKMVVNEVIKGRP